MTTERRPGTTAPILLAAALLTWPALWNGYPLVFSDTGTYLSQAVERYAGWDRPVFYSLFLLPLHLTLTTWPVVAAQALLTAHTVHLMRRTLFADASEWWLVPLTGVLTVATALPWFVSQLMPDVFTGLLVLTLALLVLAPERLSVRERIWLLAFATFMIAAHQSHVALALALLLVLLPLRRWLGAATPLNRATSLCAIAPLAVAICAMVTVNVVAFGRVAISPFGNVFLLARVIYDGPGRDVLHRDCPAAGWRLCAFSDTLPATSDDFLWRRDGPVALAGGAKVISTEANAIVVAALRSEPAAALNAVLHNLLQQLTRFATGDGLQAWPATVTPWLEREFPPSEASAYASSRQTSGILVVPPWLNNMHATVALASIAGLLLPLCKQQTNRGFAVAVLLALLVNATITGALSTPHDRYQSRIMWLPPLVLLLSPPRVATR